MQDEEQGINITPYQSPMYNYSGSILLLTNPENELYKMELSLRNMILDKEGNPKSVGKPLMNDSGIASVIGQIQAIVNQVTIMSDLNQREIPILMDLLGDSLAKDLMLNRVHYKIESASSRDKIYYIALASAFICMKRAFESGEKKFWKGSQQEITTRVEAQQKKGLLQSALGWGNK